MNSLKKLCFMNVFAVWYLKALVKFKAALYLVLHLDLLLRRN